MVKTDVTDKVYFGLSDDEFLPILKCVCGAEFVDWDFSISMYENDPKVCPSCGRKFFFDSKVTVYEVE